MKEIAISLVLFVLLIRPMFCQEQKSDYTQLINEDIAKIKETYYNSGFSRSYLHGELYLPINSLGYHPFFIDDKWTEGDIVYQNKKYQVEGLKYDILKDCIVLFHTYQNKVIPIKLNPIFTREFDIYSKHFRYLDKDNDFFYKPGYYQVLYDGNTKFYTKWEKVLKISDENRKMEARIIKTSYIYIGEKYCKVKGKRVILKLMGDQRKEMKSFMKMNDIYYNFDMEKSIYSILEHYDNISK
ncbi:MAG: hypothetical protein JXB49_00530 [Bacteroidales bacterium]|nr:hypothetical protein [Bacteroidales bacterium]